MINNDELKLLAELSKLGIPEEKYDEYAKEMQEIVSLMDTIADAECEYDPKDMSRAISFNELRDDNELRYDNMNALIKNAPVEKDEQFVVPKVVE